ncbi:TPA: YlbF family regulator [bacterium]|jgi:cell fate (sporulation/competence/biofilm development) regulator YlbF (YheA/YmcA/DUF963 family)|nr:YlbF family regulator [bacterium]
MNLLLITELCNKIKETDLYQDLKKAEQDLENDMNLFPLFSKYQTIQSQIDDALKQNIDTTKLKREFIEVKKELEKDPIVKNYLTCYKNMNSFLDKITHLIFKDVVDSTLINNPFQRWK